MSTALIMSSRQIEVIYSLNWLNILSLDKEGEIKYLIQLYSTVDVNSVIIIENLTLVNDNIWTCLYIMLHFVEILGS